MSIEASKVLDQLPPVWDKDLIPSIRESVIKSNKKIIVLDDDPTGTQTVYETPVLTSWEIPELAKALSDPQPLVYILTNSRSLPSQKAVHLNQGIIQNINQANKDINRSFVIVSRSDSTLRGHFPDEVDAILELPGMSVDGIILAPYFEEGRRYTLDDTHYVGDGDIWTPAGDTEFAKDAVFGYKSSNLRQWVSEKTKGKVNPNEVMSVDLSIIRSGGPGEVKKILMGLQKKQICIVNAVTYRDLEVFVRGLLDAEDSGKTFIYRTAASFVRVRAGLPAHGLLTPDNLPDIDSNSGGIIVAGSYVKKSTRQLEHMQNLSGIFYVQLDVEKIIDSGSRNEEIKYAITKVETALQNHKDVLLFTSRDLITQTPTLGPLEIGERVSNALVDIVKNISISPAWIIAKGGITSSDIATKALGIRSAEVLGQIIPGVPVWKTGPESKWDKKIYVVFPGNVGTDSSISEVVTVLRKCNRSV